MLYVANRCTAPVSWLCIEAHAQNIEPTWKDHTPWPFIPSVKIILIVVGLVTGNKVFLRSGLGISINAPINCMSPPSVVWDKVGICHHTFNIDTPQGYSYNQNPSEVSHHKQIWRSMIDLPSLLDKASYCVSICCSSTLVAEQHKALLWGTKHACLYDHPQCAEMYTAALFPGPTQL